MNVTAAARVPHQAHQRTAVRPTVEDGGDGSGTTDVGGADGTSEDTSTKRGGSDTPFTHALFQGNGKKLGILKRMPTPEDIAAEQAAAGLDPTGGEAAPVDGAEGADGTAPADGSDGTVDPSADGGAAGADGTIGIDGSALGDLTGVGDDTSLLDELAEAVEEAVADAGAAAEAAAEEAAAEDDAPTAA